MAKGPSTHLTWKELACKDGTPYPDKFVQDGRVYRLATMFESIRQLCGSKPITIDSAYRTPSWNRKIEGARFSQHMEGRALDLQPPQGLNVEEFYNLIHGNHRELNVNGIGKYRTFVHVDIRITLNDRLVVWYGNGVKDSGSNA